MTNNKMSGHKTTMTNRIGNAPAQARANSYSNVTMSGSKNSNPGNDSIEPIPLSAFDKAFLEKYPMSVVTKADGSRVTNLKMSDANTP
jgi:hypothetical protein